jgi:hypothetical protein
MAELEIRHEIEGDTDPVGQRVGVQASIVAVVLAVVTILSHRTHTSAVLLKAEGNDTWQRYQSTRVKLHSLELGADLMSIMPAKGNASRTLAAYEEARARYEQQSAEIQTQANEKEAETRRSENRALCYDLGEGLLEIGLVLSSLYFIARRMLFPRAGWIAAMMGVLLAAAALLV